MNTLLANAGRAFLKAFLASLLIVAPGVLHQPDFNAGLAAGIAALMASIAAGLAAIQTFVPQLTLAAVLPAPYGSIIDTFIRGFLGAFITAIIGILNEPVLSGWHALIVGALVGSINAGLQAVQGLLTLGQRPLMSYGITIPAETTTRKEA